MPVRTPLPAAFYARDTVQVARALVGCVLETTIGGERTAGRIVEVEAYVGAADPADHGYGNRRTVRNAALFGPPGISYVYFIYGMHWCFNAVTERANRPTAVLVRAIEPLEGVELMQRRRRTDRVELLCAGPARLCQALGINGACNGRSLVDGPVRVLQSARGPRRVVTSGPRIGVARARDWPLRFAEHGSPWLSRPIAPPARRAHTRRGVHPL